MNKWCYSVNIIFLLHKYCMRMYMRV